MSTQKQAKRTAQDIPPFESIDAANDAMSGLFDEVAALREKYGLHHALFVAMPVCRTEDGDNVFTAQAVFRFGSDAEILLQVASLYGRLKAEYTSTLERALSRPAKKRGSDGK